jgi:hypothetical protein
MEDDEHEEEEQH